MSRKIRKIQPDWLRNEREVDSVDNGYDSDSNEDDNEVLNNSEEQLSESEYSDSEVDGKSCDDDPKGDNNSNDDNNNNNESSSSDNDSDEDDGETLLGKDKVTKWLTNAPNSRTKTPQHNIVLRLSNVKKNAQSTKTPLDCWKLFFPEHCVEEIVKFTNMYLEKLRPNYQDISSVRPTTIEEMYAFIGLLYVLGLYKASHLNLREFWTPDGTAPDCIRAVMSLNRFRALMAAIRFDDRNDREERKKTDNLAAIREFSSGFIQRCTENYSAGAFTTIDEMLEGFRGKCKFRQYIPSKPARYGIKIYSLVDAKSFYTLNMEIYCGKQPPGPFEQSNSSFDLVKRLITPISGTGRHVTCDKFFTSIQLAEDILKNHKTTIVGTIRKNKRELTPEILNVKNRNLCSSKFIFKDNCTVVSYVPKKNKNVLLLSTLHHTAEIDKDSGFKLKPEILTFYNMTKGGVDVVDELKGNYSVARETDRWPMVIFFSFLNIAAVNAQIIWSQNTQQKIERRKFIRELSVQLTQPHLVTRSKVPNLSADLRNTIHKVGNIPVQTVETNSTKQVCRFCPRQKNSYSKKCCSSCGLAICPKHSTLLCPQCHEIMMENDGDS